MSSELIGKSIEVYYDEEERYFPGRVINYITEEDVVEVIYEDNPHAVYKEDLKVGKWRIPEQEKELSEENDNDDQSWKEEEEEEEEQEEYMPDVEQPKKRIKANERTRNSKYSVYRDDDGQRRGKEKKATYAEMLMEAVMMLQGKDSASLEAIRKVGDLNSSNGPHMMS